MLEIEADTERPVILLITDAFTPSWRAVALPGSVQTSYKLLPANYILRAVPLLVGHHHLRIEYTRDLLTIGKWISILAALAFLAALGRCATLDRRYWSGAISSRLRQVKPNPE
jgi:hypothetical protein